jgi:hypothetical protein
VENKAVAPGKIFGIIFATVSSGGTTVQNGPVVPPFGEPRWHRTNGSGARATVFLEAVE